MITDPIKITDDFLSNDLISECKDSLNSLKNQFVWGVNKFVWAPVLEISPGEFYITSVPTDIRQSILTECQERHGISMPEDTIVMFYMGMKFSGIQWHKDLYYDWAMSIYLNSEWEEDWGGLYEYSHDTSITPTSEINQVLPLINRCVFQDNNLNHRVTPTTGDAMIRESIQLFSPIDTSNTQNPLVRMQMDELRI